MTDAQRERWETVLGTLAVALPRHGANVVVEGEHAAAFADRLAEKLRSSGRGCIRLSAGDESSAGDGDSGESGESDPISLTGEAAPHTERAPRPVVLADDPQWREHPPPSAGRWDLLVRLNAPGHQHAEHTADSRPAAYVVVDLGDPNWPVIRRMTGDLSTPERWYLAENRAFFSVRAANWDTKFGEDLPAYAAAVAESAPPRGGTALDLGCGTGRALPSLREAVGPGGRVVGLDLTPQMLEAVRSSGRGNAATALLLGDARQLPFADASIDLIFAAGLINHLDNPPLGLRELARVTKPGGRLAVFHPTGRAALAARRGRVLGADEPLAEHLLRAALAENGWKLDYYDDPAHRFLAIATRR